MQQPPAKIVAHSINAQTGQQIISFELFMWKPVVGELARHRMLSLSVGSSRAVPLAKMRQNIHDAPFLPKKWGANKSGMQSTDGLDPVTGAQCELIWKKAMEAALHSHMLMEGLGLHKQYTNRLIEPFMHVPVLVTATDVTNLYRLRCHPDAQPEIRENIEAARELHSKSEPEVLLPGQWHVVYLSEVEKELLRSYESEGTAEHAEAVVKLLRFSAARAARVSYFWHNGDPCDQDKELAIAKKLMGAEPFHASPFEHQAVAYEPGVFPGHSGMSHLEVLRQGEHIKNLRERQQGNFRNGWLQHRGLIESQVEPYCVWEAGG